jgi:glycosyltransferase involved in cell wall biosynthesis
VIRGARAGAWPTITVVTPSFNQAAFLEETLSSVLDQDYPNIEYIVVDGGSTDGSVDILRRHESRFAWWVSEPDGGQSAAINKAFARSNGSIMGYLNSDDLLLPGALTRIARFFVRHGSERSLLAPFGGGVFGEGVLQSWHEPPRRVRAREWLTTRTSLFQPSTYWTRSLWRRLGGFREDLRFAFDKEFFLRAIFREKAYRRGTPAPLAMFRIHPSSKTSRMADRRDLENHMIAREHEDRGWMREVLAREEPEALAREHLNRARSAGSRSEGLRELWSATKAWPYIFGRRPYLAAVLRALGGGGRA